MGTGGGTSLNRELGAGAELREVRGWPLVDGGVGGRVGEDGGEGGER